MTKEEQAELNNKLLYATANGNDEEVERLIAAGADVNTSDEFKTTPLYYAVGEGHTTIVNKLIEKGVNVNFVDGSGRTPLHMAATFGHIEAARALIAAKADVNAVNRFGQTPLHLAAKEGRTKIAQELIAAGARVNAVDENGQTPLDFAKTQGDEFYNIVINDIAEQINDTEKAMAFKMGIHDRLGKESLLNNLVPDLFDKIMKNLTPVIMKLDDIPEKHRKAVEERLNELHEKHVDSHATKVAAGRNNDHSQARS